MSAIKTVQYAPGYPWGATKGTGTSYLLNDASAAIGDTVIPVDGGSGTIIIGDYITIAGHTKGYEVTVALTGGNLTIASPGLAFAHADNAAVTVQPNWTTVTDFLEEDFEPGIENIISVRMGEGGDKQDGVELQGSVLVSGANVPAEQRNWFKFNPFSGTSQVVGGVKGARTRLGKTNLRPLGGGPQYTRVEFSATGSSKGDTVEDANN